MSQPSSARPFVIDQHEYPFASHWLVHDGIRLHYVDEGSSVPVLLLHGNPTWSFLYRDVIKALRGTVRLIAPDYPGFGCSDHPPGYGYTPVEHAQWVTRLVDSLALDRFILVGHDWGGPIGLSLAVERPDRIAGLVLSNTWCWPPTWDAWLFSLIMGSRGLGWFLNVRLNAFARWIVPWGVAHKARLTPSVRLAYTAPFPTPSSRRGTWTFPQAIRRSAAWLAEIADRLHVLRHTPAVLVWGMQDPAFGHARVPARWRALLPQAEVDSVHDARHYVPEDRPDRVVAAIRTVLSPKGTTT